MIRNSKVIPLLFGALLLSTAGVLAQSTTPAPSTSTAAPAPAPAPKATHKVPASSTPAPAPSTNSGVSSAHKN